MRIAFIDYSFHKKTKSFDFFREIIREHHVVTDFWDEVWEGGKPINIDEINNGNFDVILFLQIIVNPLKIKKLKCKNIIWVPMYDTEITRRFSRLRLIGYLYFNIKVISFSRALTSKFKKFGFDMLNVQYYPQPNFIEHSSDELTILFWQRIKQINLFTVKNILADNKIKEIFFQNNPDPRHKTNLPTQEEVEKFHITIINGWIGDKEYSQLLRKCNIYIAPRVYEGIGMGFLNVMATGSVVIASNKPTMSEYIENGVSGYLYDVKNPKKIDLSSIKTIQENIKEKIEKGFSVWQRQQKDILAYLEVSSKQRNKKVNLILFYIYCLYSPVLEILRKIKRFLQNIFIDK